MAPHSSTLAWKIPWTEEPGGLQSMVSLRVGHDRVTSLSLFTFMHWRRKWQPPSVLAWRIPGTGEPGGLPSMGSHRVGHDWSDSAAAAAEVKSPTASAGDVGVVGSVPVSGRSSREGDGNPYQYPCLENSMDRGACWATVHRIARSQTRVRMQHLQSHSWGFYPHDLITSQSPTS